MNKKYRGWFVFGLDGKWVAHRHGVRVRADTYELVCLKVDFKIPW